MASNFPITREKLSKWYFPFEIALTAIFAICLIPLVGLFYLTFGIEALPSLGLGTFAVPLAIANVFGASYKNDPAKTKTFDIVILAMSIITFVPLIGWFSAAVAFGFSITNLVKYRKWKKG